MREAANGSSLRSAVWDAIKECSRPGRPPLDFNVVSKAVVEKLSPPGQLDHSLSDSILSYWNDLLRTGHLGMSSTASSSWTPTVFHVTDEGRKASEHADRDPINPGGYLAYLDAECPLDPSVRGYVEEALGTYRPAATRRRRC